MIDANDIVTLASELAMWHFDSPSRVNGKYGARSGEAIILKSNNKSGHIPIFVFDNRDYLSKLVRISNSLSSHETATVMRLDFKLAK